MTPTILFYFVSWIRNNLNTLKTVIFVYFIHKHWFGSFLAGESESLILGAR